MVYRDTAGAASPERRAAAPVDAASASRTRTARSPTPCPGRQGHPYVQKVLDGIQPHVRGRDVVARIGGEESAGVGWIVVELDSRTDRLCGNRARLQST